MKSYRRSLLSLPLLCAITALGACEPKANSSKSQQPAPNFQDKKAEEAIPPAAHAEPPNAAPSSSPAALPEQTPTRIYRVAALGDSITDARAGGGGYLKVLQQKCPQSEFFNFGKGGDMSNQMRARLERDLLPQVAELKLNTLLVYGGVNDLYSDLTAGRSNAKIEDDLSRIYALASKAGLKVVALTVSPWGGFSRYWNPRRGDNTRLLNSWIMGQVSTGNVWRAVDTFAELSCGDSNQLCPDYESRFHDGLHPGPKGHIVLGEKVFKDAFFDCQ